MKHEERAEAALRAVNELRKLLTKQHLTGRKDPAFTLDLDPPSTLLNEQWLIVKILKKNGFGPWNPKKTSKKKSAG